MARFLGLAELFERRRFDREIIVLCVRWHLRFKLSQWLSLGRLETHRSSNLVRFGGAKTRYRRQL
jgi:hypothetical protein